MTKEGNHNKNSTVANTWKNRNTKFIVDSGATSHMVKDDTCLNIVKGRSKITVSVGDGI